MRNTIIENLNRFLTLLRFQSINTIRVTTANRYSIANTLMHKIRGALVDLNENKCPDDPATVNRCQQYRQHYTLFHKGVCYTLHTETLSWNNAKNSCEVIGGRLVKMEDKGLGNTIYSLKWYRESKPAYKLNWWRKLWLGGRIENDGNYWIDGTKISWDNWQVTTRFADWIKGLFSERQLCVSMHKRLFIPFWEKEPCYKDYYYVCEHDSIKTIASKRLRKLETGKALTSVGPTQPKASSDKAVTTERARLSSPSGSSLGNGLETKPAVTMLISQARGPTVTTNISQTGTTGISQATGPPITTVIPQEKESAVVKQASERTMLKGIPVVKDMFNPQLLQTPSRFHTISDLEECARWCKFYPECQLININTKTGHCGLYNRAEDALKAGVMSVDGWRVYRMRT